MNITGEMLIGQSSVRGNEGTLRAINPANNEKIGPDFGAGGRLRQGRSDGKPRQIDRDRRHRYDFH